MRMTRRVKPPTAAVTMTSTCPWSEATSDAEGRAEEMLGGGGKASPIDIEDREGDMMGGK